MAGNKRKKSKGARRLAAFIIGAAVFLAVILFHLLGVFKYLEYKSYDLRVNLFAESRRPSDDIIVILLDQASLDWANQERGWGWPWPRKAYSELVDYMNLAGAKAVAFDVIFSEPSVYRNARQDAIIDEAVENLESLRQNTERVSSAADRRGIGPGFRAVADALRSLSMRADDDSFVQSSKDFGRVVQTVFISTDSGYVAEWPEDLDKPLLEPVNFGSVLPGFNITSDTDRIKALFPIPELQNSAGVIGSVTSMIDSDGIIRRSRLFTMFDGKAVPGLSAASLLAAGHEDRIVYDEKMRIIEWGDYRIPVSKDGGSLLRFRGTLDRYIPYSAQMILMSAEAHANNTTDKLPFYLPPENFEGRYVFFGFYAPGLFDICSTPIESVYPGMGVHITMLDNILSRDFIKEVPLWINVIIIFGSVFVIVALALFSGKIPLSLGGTVFILAAQIIAALISYNVGYWLLLVAPLAAGILAFLSATLYNYATEGSQKRFIKSAFSQYLSPAVIEQIIADPSQLKLGGEKREMTAIFTDVRSFSTISEALGDPAKLVELLNFYLTRMSNIVLANQGTIDKYEGDAIIAFFGAPLYLPNHASLACRSVIQMKKAEIEINKEAVAQGLITDKVMEAMFRKGIIKDPNDPNPLFTRLGVNTGDMVVGNMGTPNKMDYTIMGNAVNLAARLEGVNKQYDTGGILISEYTRDKIGDEFIMRPLSRVRVVGINTPLRLYELLDIKEEAPKELLDMIPLWDKAIGAYERREFIEAQNLFKIISEKNNEDRVSQLYCERCRKYIAAPPPDEKWDNGVDNLTEK